MYKYQAFALTIHSEFPFPELLADPNPESSDPAQIIIKFGTVSSQGLGSSNSVNGLFYQAMSSALWLHVPHVARFLIMQGHQIIIDPVVGADEDSIRLFLLGSCMGALLIQRNFFLLHGNAIKMGDHCISFVGRSGIGKSTLAGAFFKQGYSILTDDVCAINAEGLVMPSFPQIKLWFDAAKHLDIETGVLRKIRPGIEKFAVPLAQQFHHNALPLKLVYVLHAHNKDEIKFTNTTGMRKLPPLQNHTYRQNYVKGLTQNHRYFKQCGQLASQIEVVCIARPKDGFTLDELVCSIENDLIARSLYHAC